MMNVFVALMVIGVTTAFAANEKTETFKVSGNCGMCEKTIEKAASKVDGVTTADWDKEKKTITITFDESKVEIMAIHKAIAKAGYDTEKVKAKDETYGELPSCCQYDREAKPAEDHSGHKH